MRNIFLILFSVLICGCTATVSNNDAEIVFTKEKHRFGKIPLKKEREVSFEFSNAGKSMLVIYDVKTSCGCTVPEWTKEPIRPEKKGEIIIKYDAGFPGTFHKTIEVFYNGKGSPARLEIEGEVE